MIQNLNLLQTPEYQQKLNQCIHCGLCLQACPTYLVFGTEMDAPRGRIALMRAVSDGRVGLGDFQQSISPHINLCLACRSCETACPSGVRYGELVETARLLVESNRKPGWAERTLRKLGLDGLMPYPGRLKFMARLLKIYQVVGLQALVRRLNILPGPLKTMEGILPPIQPQYTPEAPPLNSNEPTRRILFFTGCIQEAFLAPVNRATERVLHRNGFRVVAPSEQTCCGAAHLHLGDLESARSLARQNIDAFLAECRDGEMIVTNAGGCGLSLKEYHHLLSDDPEYAERARQFASRVRDVSEILATDIIESPRGQVTARVTYADSCHLRHGQKVVRQPRDLLRSIPGVEYVDLAFPDQCCGSAGVYNIAQNETAEVILQAKLEDIRASGAQILVTTNTGCHMQLMSGVRRAGLPIKVMHLVELLDLAYANEN
ncbi:MAG: protein of unknown function cysteine-rich region domain protein [Chloroflexi bacterium]|nr:protein of unknown function cysteine-rich region domain protein [Chloroflexota bacterium]